MSKIIAELHDEPARPTLWVAAGRIKRDQMEHPSEHSAAMLIVAEWLEGVARLQDAGRLTGPEGLLAMRFTCAYLGEGYREPSRVESDAA